MLLSSPRLAKISFFAALGLMGLFLLVRAGHPQRFSEWDFGDAQTLLAIENWKHEGMAQTAFLWIPQGWFHLSHAFDLPDALNHHAHGTRGMATGVAPRRIYTHYPSGYAVPLGLLAKMGMDSKQAYQSLAIFFSLLAVCFFFFFLLRYFPPWFCFWASVFYLTSPGFLGYADALANQPLDDLGRFAFLLAWDRWIHPVDFNKNTLCWGLSSYLIYALHLMTSLDSFLFLGGFALVWEYVFLRPKFPLKTLLLLPAFLGGVGVSFLQNTLYLGWQGAFADWFGTLGDNLPNDRGEHKGLFSILLHPLAKIERLLRESLFTSLSESMMVIVLGLLWMRERIQKKLFLLLLFCGFLWSVVFAEKTMHYQIRQLTPWMTLALTSLFFSLGGKYPFSRPLSKKGQTGVRLVSFGLGLFFLFHTHATLPLQEVWDFPPRPRLSPQFQSQYLGATHPSQSQRSASEQLLLTHSSCVPLFLDTGAYPQAHPWVEVLVGGPVLAFKSTWDLKKDFHWIKTHQSEILDIWVLWTSTHPPLEKLKTTGSMVGPCTLYQASF